MQRFIKRFTAPFNLSMNEESTMWAEEMLGEAVSRYKEGIDPLDRKLLLVFRTLEIKFRLDHSIGSQFHRPMHVSETMKGLLKVAICDFGFNYLAKNDIKMILVDVR